MERFRAGIRLHAFPILVAPEKIDEPLAIHMIHSAVDAGVNYMDTAYPYHGGNSEVLVGKALRDGYREKMKLATKMPGWLVKEAADFDRLFKDQLHRLRTDHVDVYLFHALGSSPPSRLRCQSLCTLFLLLHFL